MLKHVAPSLLIARARSTPDWVDNQIKHLYRLLITPPMFNHEPVSVALNGQMLNKELWAFLRGKKSEKSFFKTLWIFIMKWWRGSGFKDVLQLLRCHWRCSPLASCSKNKPINSDNFCLKIDPNSEMFSHVVIFKKTKYFIHMLCLHSEIADAIV